MHLACIPILSSSTRGSIHRRRGPTVSLTTVRQTFEPALSNRLLLLKAPWKGMFFNLLGRSDAGWETKADSARVSWCRYPQGPAQARFSPTHKQADDDVDARKGSVQNPNPAEGHPVADDGLLPDVEREVLD